MQPKNAAAPPTGIHVLVVGKGPAADSVIDDVANQAVETPSFRVVRCAAPEELVEKVYPVSREYGPIGTLDLYDHASAGVVYMGGVQHVLFDSTGVGRDRAAKLGKVLVPDAQVRLLGCESALSTGGRDLLLGLQKAFGGQRVVWGTTVHTGLEAFTDGVFEDDWEKFLFSSTDAQTRVATSPNEILAEIRSRFGHDAMVKVTSLLIRTALQLQNPDTCPASCCAK